MHISFGRGLALKLFCSVATVAALFFAARSASAYPWMIRHQYTGCTPCHADPSGGGLLTEYGRAMGDTVLRMQYGRGEVEEASPSAGFLFGAVKTPEWLLAGGSVRTLLLRQKVEGQDSVTRFIQMQADLRAQVNIGRFHANGSLGYMHDGGRGAAITHREQDNLVSREHWLGADLDEDQRWMLRAGRMNLPFGVRSIEHTQWVRQTTRTDINDSQQLGLALAYSGDVFRGELMGIAGNYVLNPDDYRERGYSGFIEAAVSPRVALGLSSLLTYAARDIRRRVPNIRQAHGLTVRASPIDELVILGEADMLVDIPQGGAAVVGYAAMGQLDVEFIQGLHGIVTLESRYGGADGESPSWGGWISGAWFFAPHTDFRVDVIDQLVWAGTGHVNALSLLGQLHMYL